MGAAGTVGAARANRELDDRQQRGSRRLDLNSRPRPSPEPPRPAPPGSTRPRSRQGLFLRSETFKRKLRTGPRARQAAQGKPVGGNAVGRQRPLCYLPLSSRAAGVTVPLLGGSRPTLGAAPDLACGSRKCVRVAPPRLPSFPRIAHLQVWFWTLEDMEKVSPKLTLQCE